MRIVFVSNVWFGNELLNHLANRGDFKIVGVISSEKNIHENGDYRNLCETAKQLQIESHSTDNINSEATLSWIKSKDPDLIICIGWSRIFGTELLGIPKLFTIGYHPSLLPRHAGRHPIIWALALGLRSTGSTFFRMDEGVDSGQVLSQAVVKIHRHADAKALYQALITSAKAQLPVLLRKIAKGNIPKPSQKKNAKPSYWRKRSSIDGTIDWRMSSNSIYNLHRALSFPYNGCTIVINGANVRVIALRSFKSPSNLGVEPGKVIRSIAGVYDVKCGDGFVRLFETDPPISLEEGTYL